MLESLSNLTGLIREPSEKLSGVGKAETWGLLCSEGGPIAPGCSGEPNEEAREGGSTGVTDRLLPDEGLLRNM